MAAKSYTGAVATPVIIQGTPATIQSISVNAAATAVLTIFDNATLASGTIVFQKSFAAATFATFDFTRMGGLRLANGATATVATATCEVTLNVT
jgi:hypothetical protein